MQLRLGCLADLPVQRLQAFLGLLYERDPELDVDVAHLPSHQQIELLRAGELDLALIHDPHDDGTISTEPVFPGARLAAFLSVFHPLSTCASVSPEDLGGETLITAPRAGDPALHDWLLAEVTSNGYAFRAVRETRGSDPRDVLFAVAERRGVALRPRSALRLAADLGDVVAGVPLEPAVTMPATLLAWMPAHGPGAALQDVAREAARALYATTD
jgi:DNA-binding transcriptional LysR family regulator